METGDFVRLIGIPTDVHDDEHLQTRSLFEKCLGHVFRVQAVEHAEGLSTPLVRLDVGHIVGKESYKDTIWVEPEHLEIVPSS
jgi:hypothetical protein